MNINILITKIMEIKKLPKLFRKKEVIRKTPSLTYSGRVCALCDEKQALKGLFRHINMNSFDVM